MKKKKRVVVFDDDRQRERQWIVKLKKVKNLTDYFTFEAAESQEFISGIEVLERRRQLARDSATTTHSKEKSNTVFDDADVLVVDYDLFDPKMISTTGERVAYLARCYSNCGIIIGVNQFVRGGRSSFDLTLRGHPESFADINVGENDLFNEGLWIQPTGGFQGFRPWYWPLIYSAVDAFEKRCNALVQNLDKSILEYLHLDKVIDLLPRTSVEFIERGAKSLSTATFRNFVENSGNGLRLKDKTMNDKTTARIAAARIFTWLESMVRPSQDILVDAPHLIARYPSLVLKDRMSIDAWNAAVSITTPMSAEQKKVASLNLIDKLRFKKDDWTSRPVWFWHQVNESYLIDEVKDPFKQVDKLDVVFCEDISRFMLRDSAIDFSADVTGPFNRRFVVDTKEVKGAERTALARVDYEPKVRFVL